MHVKIIILTIKKILIYLFFKSVSWLQNEYFIHNQEFSELHRFVLEHTGANSRAGIDYYRQLFAIFKKKQKAQFSMPAMIIENVSDYTGTFKSFI